MSPPSPRASCIRCNALLGSDRFEADWRFAQCACGMRSPLPETVQRERPDSFAGGVARAIEDVLAQRPADVRVSIARASLGELVLRASLRVRGIRDVVPALLRAVLAPEAGRRSFDRPALVRWSLTVRARPESGRWKLTSSDARSPDAVLEGPFVVVARGAAERDASTIVVCGGHPISEEWVAGHVPSSRHAGWIAEWIGAALRAHVEESASGDRRRAPRAYRR